MSAELFSDSALKNWEKSGKSEFLKACKQSISSNTSSLMFDQDGNASSITTDLYDLLSNAIKGNIRKDSVVTVLQDLSSLHTDMNSLILDIFNVFDVETSLLDAAAPEKAILSFIIKSSEPFLTERLMKERLEIDSLQDMKILNNKNFYSKFIKVKTKLYYKQRKFNLFREESEGFSKLITDLSRAQSSGETSEQCLEDVKSLIGCFNLDPNRVLDVILELFEQHYDCYSFYVPLIKAYMPNPKILCEVLGFKFSSYHNSFEPTRKSLFLLTATMLQHGIIHLDDVYVWLVPQDSMISKEFEKELNNAKEYANKLNIISTKDKEAEKEVKKDIQNKYETNQKFGLAEALLTVGDWNTFERLRDKLPTFCLVDQPPIATALCNLISRTIEPLYRKKSGLGPKVKGAVVAPFECTLTPKPCQEFTDVRETVLPMLFTLGPGLHHDVVLASKIIRLVYAALSDLNIDPSLPPPPEDSLYYDVISILDLVILPTLSHIEANAALNEDIWEIIKLYPYQTRYFLYARWKNEAHENRASLIRKRADAMKKVKGIMKRVSKENVKPAGRHIGKLSHYCPGYLFDYMLIQMQTYDNLILPVVDSLKYLTAMEYDVLTYCIVETLTRSEKDRFKNDGMSMQLWLSSMSSFCGNIFKKYNMELVGVLQYIANKLKQQKSLDLCILKEIIQKMAGIEVVDDITDEQLEAMCGGEVLRNEAGFFMQVRNTKRSSSRLKEALCNDNLAVALCLLLAQQKNCIIYRETSLNSHLKLVGKLYDECQDTLVQFGTFLGSNMSMDEYVARLPSIQSLLLEYHISIDVAFFIARPMFSHTINSKYEALRKLDPNTKKDPAVKQEKYIEAVNEVMNPVIKSVIPLHPPKVWEDISPEFLVTFWSCSTYDLFVPTEAYAREINKLKQTSLNTMDSKEMGSTKIKKEAEKFSTMIEKLTDEKKKQHEHVERVMARLNQEKDNWFLSRSAKGAKNETISQFLQLCIFPRCIFTTVDAVFCAKFIHLLHKMKAANFSSLLCYDRLFCDITHVVTLCTENEAHRYGRFLACLLETVMHWHSDKKVYEEECADNPGFITKCRVSSKELSDPNQSVGYENFRHACHKWHYKITKSIMLCLESKDYVQIRNAFIVLRKILPYFPVLSKLSIFIEKTVNKVRDEEKNKRQDLHTLATSYCRFLIAKSPNLMKESDFHDISDKLKKPTAAASSATAAAKQPTTPTTEVKKENEVKKATTTTNGVEKAAASVNGTSVAVKAETVEKKAVTTKEKAERRVLNRAVADIKSEQASIKKEKDNNSGTSTPTTKESKKRSKSKEQHSPPAEKRSREHKKEKDTIILDHDEPHGKSRRGRNNYNQSPTFSYSEHRRSGSPPTPHGFVTISSPRSPQYADASPSFRPNDWEYKPTSPSYFPTSPTSPGYNPREVYSSISNSSSGSLHRHHSPSGERTDRESKRRRIDGTISSKSSKHSGGDRDSGGRSQNSAGDGKKEKREKREKKSIQRYANEKLGAPSGDSKEKESLRKKKLKRERGIDVSQIIDEKKRVKESKLGKASKQSLHANGDQFDHRESRSEKHHYNREKSADAFVYERETRERGDKHSRRTGDKRR